ncbi:MAG: ATP-binding protein [Gammaproteobacteria bacterium]|nr:ATP-binding protein [Gammaproteobacteria bacterium]
MARKRTDRRGRLRIGDHGSAISIIALSQDNPLKAVAEFVENSIDARARTIEIVRGRERGQPYLKITDDGDGLPQDKDGRPDFKYVATHICDSIKKELKRRGEQGLQGEFGIGLLSFWTLGEALTMTSPGADGTLYEMSMRRNDEGYAVRSSRRTLFAGRGVEVLVRPLLKGIRQFSGEKLHWYLASELRDRIRETGVNVRIIDRTARKSYTVKPRAFDGRLIHELDDPATRLGPIKLELYLDEPSPTRRPALYRNGTRVAELGALGEFQETAWTSGYVDGIVDAPFVSLTPGTRTGVIRDAAYDEFRRALGPVTERLDLLIVELQRAEEERASQQTLRSIQRAFREALLALPAEEYDWFEVRSPARNASGGGGGPGAIDPVANRQQAALAGPVEDAEAKESSQVVFYERAGPLYMVSISPASSVLKVGQTRSFRAVCRDRSRRPVDEGLAFAWNVAEGGGEFDVPGAEIVEYRAPGEPGLVRLTVAATQNDVVCEAEALVTVTDSLIPDHRSSAPRQGLPGYTYEKAPGQTWRSRYDLEQNFIVINNGHRDFVFSSKSRASQVRYIARLFVKELVLRNFPGASPPQLLERMLELMLYLEKNLR